jgi:hypothetical protein
MSSARRNQRAENSALQAQLDAARLTANAAILRAEVLEAAEAARVAEIAAVRAAAAEAERLVAAAAEADRQAVIAAAAAEVNRQTVIAEAAAEAERQAIFAQGIEANRLERVRIESVRIESVRVENERRADQREEENPRDAILLERGRLAGMAQAAAAANAIAGGGANPGVPQSEVMAMIAKLVTPQSQMPPILGGNSAWRSDQAAALEAAINANLQLPLHVRQQLSSILVWHYDLFKHIHPSLDDTKPHPPRPLKADYTRDIISFFKYPQDMDLSLQARTVIIEFIMTYLAEVHTTQDYEAWWECHLQLFRAFLKGNATLDQFKNYGSYYSDFRMFQFRNERAPASTQAHRRQHTPRTDRPIDNRNGQACRYHRKWHWLELNHNEATCSENPAVSGRKPSDSSSSRSNTAPRRNERQARSTSSRDSGRDTKRSKRDGRG